MRGLSVSLNRHGCFANPAADSLHFLRKKHVVAGPKKMERFEISIKIPIHPKAKFGLKAILLLLFFVAIGFAAFKFGRERGHREGYKQGYENGWSESQQSKLVKRSYSVSDLVENGSKTMSNIWKLTQDIEKSVQRDSWDANGGPAEITPYPPSLSLVINQTQRGHEEVERYLARFRSTHSADAQ